MDLHGDGFRVMAPPAFTADAAAPTWVAGCSIAGVADVLPMRLGSRASLGLLESAGLAQAWRGVPAERASDVEVRRLHRVLREQLGTSVARAVARDAGERAADHLAARLVPPAMQTVLRGLPASLAARLLLGRLRREAWTFAGDAQVEVLAGRPAVVTVRGNPFCKGVHSDDPSCDFVCAMLERWFTLWVHPRARAVEVACESTGASACRFEIRW